jgi:hypothetical protein
MDELAVMGARQYFTTPGKVVVELGEMAPKAGIFDAWRKIRRSLVANGYLDEPSVEQR